MRRSSVVVSFLLLAAISTAAQNSGQEILPGAFASWNRVFVAQPFVDVPSGSWASKEILDEYGLTGHEFAIYSGPQHLIVDLYRMKDPSGAYGLYSYLRTADMARADFTDHSANSHSEALVLIGNLVVEVRGPDLSPAHDDLKALFAAVSPHAEQGLLPTLVLRLPTDGMVERSDHYILGPTTLGQFFPIGSDDWLGFSLGAEVESAKYRLGGREETLLIVDFPTPQTAQKKLAEWQKRFNINGSSSSAGAPALFLKRNLTLVAIVSGAKNQAEADALLNQVHSGTEITWNEPPFEVTEPGIAAMILGTIIGTGIICAFAIISGIAFGGVRLVVKRFFPDKVFDRSNHLQVLQLGLSSKPINAEDFYGMGGGRHK